MIFDEHIEMVGSQLREERQRVQSNVWHPSGGLTVAQRSVIASIDEKLERLNGIDEACSVAGCGEKASFDHDGSGNLFCVGHYVDKRNFRL